MRQTVIAVLIAIALLLTLAACAASGDDTNQTKETDSAAEGITTTEERKTHATGDIDFGDLFSSEEDKVTTAPGDASTGPEEVPTAPEGGTTTGNEEVTEEVTTGREQSTSIPIAKDTSEGFSPMIPPMG